MKIAILAANGKIGRLLVKESLLQGINVSAFVRYNFDTSNLKQNLEEEGIESNNLDSILQNFKIVNKDIFNLKASDLTNFNVIIDAFGEWQDLSLHTKHIKYLCSILKGNEAKFIVVGGAGSLYMDKEYKIRLMDTPDFPKEYLPLAKASAEALEYLCTQNEINWLYVSPAAIFDYNAKKTNSYQIIGEEFQTNKQGESIISYKDYAMALIKLASNNTYNKQRIGLIS